VDTNSDADDEIGALGILYDMTVDRNMVENECLD
jgi:hypothetical protein